MSDVTYIYIYVRTQKEKPTPTQNSDAYIFKPSPNNEFLRKWASKSSAMLR